ncbi:MAG: tRNA adenosine(34) deaminase TadA [Pseudomonadales bacterium]|nr:tRNA adenosine(34) deaminase TadA [Pseudomonadales bacterium]
MERSIEEHERWMSEALELAKLAERADEVPVGAVVVRGDEIIGRGYNRPISGHDPTAHAEIMAIREAASQIGNYRLVDCQMYVTLEPCTMCVGAIVHARINLLVFGATEPKSGAVVSQNSLFEHSAFNHRVEYLGGVLAETSANLISGFFARRREEKKLSRGLKKQDPRI